MSAVPTVKVVDIKTNVVMIINADDFDDKKHKIFSEKQKPQQRKVTARVQTNVKTKLTEPAKQAITK